MELGQEEMAVKKLLFVLFAFLIAGAACTPKKQVRKPLEVTPAEEEATAEELNIRGTEFTNIPELAMIRFEFDQFDLSAEARNSLAKNADYLKHNAKLGILSEGHCDEKGTTEYNLALGQKRAKTVRDYYVRLGIKPKRIGTLSYGEEKPLCAESTEECWVKNRRVETKVRSGTVDKDKPSKTPSR